MESTGNWTPEDLRLSDSNRTANYGQSEDFVWRYSSGLKSAKFLYLPCCYSSDEQSFGVQSWLCALHHFVAHLEYSGVAVERESGVSNQGCWLVVEGTSSRLAPFFEDTGARVEAVHGEHFATYARARAAV